MEPNEFQIGKTYKVPLEQITPSQPPSFHFGAYSENPIDICVDNDKLLIVDGNNRYYRSLSEQLIEITARVVQNPYLAW